MRRPLKLRINIPQKHAMSLRSILNAVYLLRAIRLRPQIKILEVLGAVLLAAERNSSPHGPRLIHVELDSPVAKRKIARTRIASRLEFQRVKSIVLGELSAARCLP